jgi:hypothetical protein
MKEANYAPVYCALYPELAEVARSHGYALAVHGSVARDFDVICIPWTEKPSDPNKVVEEIISKFDLWNADKENPCRKQHGRLAWTLTIGHGCCMIDLSFMPRLEDKL